MPRKVTKQEFLDKWVVRIEDTDNKVNTLEIWPKAKKSEQDLPPGQIDKTNKDLPYGLWRAQNLPNDHPHKATALDRLARIAEEKIKRENIKPKDKVINHRVEVLKTLLEAKSNKNARGV